MVLEACILVIDTSEFMRNGDYAPSRLEAQTDAVNLICSTKTQSNPESTVGILSMSKNPSLLMALTTDLGKVFTALHKVPISGRIDLHAGLQVAALALKHRQNKNQRQRLIAFVGSPISNDQASLVKLGKKMKKNNVAIDIISFGETEVNAEKLEALNAAVNSNDNSHLVTIPPSGAVLSDQLISTPIIMGEDGENSAIAASLASSSNHPGGVDPNIDPELALALQLSLQEEEARQAPAASGSTPAAAAAAAPPPTTTSTTTTGADDEQAMLAQAIAMSMAGGDSSSATAGAPPSSGAVAAPPPGSGGADDELARALAMSMEGTTTNNNNNKDNSNSKDGNAYADPKFMESLLSDLPGVDPNSAEVQDVLKSLKKEDEKKDEKKK